MGNIITGQIIEANDILGCMRTTVEAGEAISDGDCCYIKDSDGKAYISDSSTAVHFNGIALEDATSGADVELITKGKYVTTGLTDREIYYLGSSGAISTTESSIKIGSADGTTDLYIDKEDLRSEGWAHIETLNPSDVSTISSTGTLPVYDNYKLILNINGESSNTDNMRLQFNGDTGTNYRVLYLNNTTITVGTSQPNIIIGSHNEQEHTYGEIFFKGITPTHANGRIDTQINYSAFPGAIKGLSGDWDGGSATQLTSMTFLSSTYNFSGTIEIFGRDAK
jgi:hypothetical protein